MAMNYNAKEEVDGHQVVAGSSHSGPGGGGGAAVGSSVTGGAIKSRKPDNTAFKQQRLPAWQPILTAGTVLPAFFVIGLIFIPIGIGIFVTSNNIREYEIDYTGTEPGSPCNKCLNVSWNSTPCHCIINFTLDQPFESNVFMYYGLSNFYQNHRRYVKSRDDSQLNGNNNSLFNPSKECEPYRTNEDNKPIAPCGAIANSMFNDTLTLYRIDQNGTVLIPLNKKGIAWWTDKYVKFRNPLGDNNNLTVLFRGTAKPVNWPKPVYMLDSDPDNNGFINEDFIVWMRTAALPTFRKLYRLIERKDSLLPTLPTGKYSLDITYSFEKLETVNSVVLVAFSAQGEVCERRDGNFVLVEKKDYPVHSFDGRKRMILSTISWMGGKNPFLGIAYITVGSICFFLGVVLLIIHHKYGNRNNSADIPN